VELARSSRLVIRLRRRSHERLNAAAEESSQQLFRWLALPLQAKAAQISTGQASNGSWMQALFPCTERVYNDGAGQPGFVWLPSVDN
jgi:hypothetical protein